MAAVHVQVGCERDTADEEEQGIQGIRREHEERRDGECFADGSRYEVE